MSDMETLSANQEPFEQPQEPAPEPLPVQEVPPEEEPVVEPIGAAPEPAAAPLEPEATPAEPLAELAPEHPTDQPSMAQLLEEGAYTPLRRGEIRRGTILTVAPTQIVLDIRAKREGFVPQRELEHLDPQLRDQLTVGNEIPVYVVMPEDEEGRTVVSISRGLVQADWDNAQQLLESQEIWEGRVSGQNRGGLLVEFGRLRGFVPTSHLAGFPRTLSPEDRQKRLTDMVGRRLGLRVIEVDQQRNRLVFSERIAYREWREQQQGRLLSELKEGQIVHGRVSSVQDFGAFVDLNGIEGLIHISELAWTRVEHPSEVLKVGEEVDVRVIRIDPERKRVSLSLRQTGGDPWSRIEERYSLGQLITGQVTRIASYGVFIEIEDGVEGLVHISELAEDKPTNPRDVVEEGESLPLRIIRIDAARRRLGLSARRVTTVEWEQWRASHVKLVAPVAAEEPPVVAEEVAEIVEELPAVPQEVAEIVEELPAVAEESAEIAAEPPAESDPTES